MQNFALTFGGGSPFANYLLKIKARDEMQAREYANTYVPGWCQVLTMSEAHQYILDWGVTIIEANPLVQLQETQV